jgi:hypothetical protein
MRALEGTMTKLVSFIFLSFFSLTCFSEECTRALPEPIVKNKTLINNYLLSKLQDRILIETFVLNSGQKVKIEQSGCHHFGLSYSFEVDIFPKHKTIPIALELVKSIVEVAPLGASTVYKALLSVKDHNSAPEIITITEGYNWLHISTKYEKGKSNLVLVYDIAL